MAELFARFSRRNLNILIKAQRTFICASLDSRERKEENLRELLFFLHQELRKCTVYTGNHLQKSAVCGILFSPHILTKATTLVQLCVLQIQ
jgi:hypothetical protein